MIDFRITHRAVKATLVLAFLLPLTGCALSPSAGPTRSEIVQGSGEDIDFPYALVPVDITVVERLRNRPDSLLSAKLARGERARPNRSFVLGVGDVISAMIFEPTLAGAERTGGANAGAISVPAQTIARDGLISVPYAGRIAASGRSVQQLQSNIEEALRGKFANPQVVLTLQTDRSNSVTVTGAVSASGVFPLSGNNERILDAIASAGGALERDTDLSVRVTRGGVIASAPMLAIVESPSENIVLEPGDLIYLSREPRIFTSVGLTGQSGNFPIDRRNMTVMQALGSASGINDDRATPAGVFVFRHEPTVFARSLAQDKSFDSENAETPVVYQIDLSKPDGLFLANSMKIEPNDVIFVAEARTSALFKLARILGAIVSPIAIPASFAR